MSASSASAASAAAAAGGGGSNNVTDEMQFETNSDYPPNDRPCRDPLPFPAAVHVPCRRVHSRVYDTATKLITPAERVVIKKDDDGNETRAYWLRRTLQTAIYGKVVYAVGLRRRAGTTTAAATSAGGQQQQQQQQATASGSSSSGGGSSDVEWEVTEERYAVKELRWKKINEQQALPMESRLCEDPLKEIQAMQYLKRWFENNNNNDANQPAAATGGGNEEGVGNGGGDDEAVLQTNIMMPVDTLSDSRYLYLVMPYCSGGEMFDVLRDSDSFPEGEARYWMHQILNGVETMQRAGICHRDMSLENLLVHKNSCLVIDMGMCLRIPHYTDYDDPEDDDDMDDDNNNDDEAPIHVMNDVPADDKEEETSITDMIIDEVVDNNDDIGTEQQQQLQQEQQQERPRRRKKERCLINPSGTCGKWGYMSPEIATNLSPFDGYAVDMWAIGVILFMMLTGYPPWDNPLRTDPRFRYITAGGLKRLLTEWDAGLSDDAMDLLQRMMKRDPRERLSLEQVRGHRWMVSGPRVPPPMD